VPQCHHHIHHELRSSPPITTLLQLFPTISSCSFTPWGQPLSHLCILSPRPRTTTLILPQLTQEKGVFNLPPVPSQGMLAILSRCKRGLQSHAQQTFPATRRRRFTVS
jgi:hypothetical protein